MFFIKKIFILFFSVLFLITGVIFILIATGFVPNDLWLNLMDSVGMNIKYQILSFVIGFVYVLIGVVIPYKHSKNMKKNRVVAFQNPDGEVTISLSAIEDYIRKTAKTMPEIRDLKTNVDINRRGINIKVDVAIVSEANIPEITEKVQMSVKGKIQGILGVEEKVNMKIHVKKIAGGSAGGERNATQDADEEDAAQVPFRNN